MPHSATQPELDLIQATLREANPYSVLQVGTGSFDYTKTVIETVRELPSARLTLLTGKKDSQVVADLRTHHLDQWVDIIALPADQVLPEFYFQKHTFDFAIMNTGHAMTETQVSFYFVSKLLSKNNKLIVNEPPIAGFHELCRLVLSTQDYEVHATSEKRASMPLLERIVRSQYAKLPKWVKQHTEQLLNPHILQTDSMLGLFGNTVVFNKTQEDSEITTEEEMDTSLDVDEMIEAMM